MSKKKREKIYEFETIFDPSGEGYTVTVPKLPGLVTEGSNLKEARAMAKDAIECYLQTLLKEDMPQNPKTGKIKVAV
jgi:predicted RNase H-like HicB family nuclease